LIDSSTNWEIQLKKEEEAIPGANTCTQARSKSISDFLSVIEKKLSPTIDPLVLLLIFFALGKSIQYAIG
jgi:hypothetical protein